MVTSRLDVVGSADARDERCSCIVNSRFPGSRVVGIDLHVRTWLGADGYMVVYLPLSIIMHTSVAPSPEADLCLKSHHPHSPVLARSVRRLTGFALYCL